MTSRHQVEEQQRHQKREEKLKQTLVEGPEGTGDAGDRPWPACRSCRGIKILFYRY
jgi:hypothetical protein